MLHCYRIIERAEGSDIHLRPIITSQVGAPLLLCASGLDVGLDWIGLLWLALDGCPLLLCFASLCWFALITAQGFMWWNDVVSFVMP